MADEAFTYDQVGNRLSSADVSGGWLYNGNNELLQAGNRAEYKYDAAGNIIEKKAAGKILTFEYDLDNHLSRVADGNNATVASYGYDFLRRRIWKDVRGVKTFYHYSDSGLVAEMDSNGNTLKSYGYRPGSPWGTDPLFMRENGKSYWYLNDHLGTPQMVVAENGGVVWKAQYQVFGKAEIDGGSTLTNNLRFPGQYFDEETGLHYNWNRYYDPESGRYSQTDPIGLRGGINLYGYTQNNSLNFIDPEGEHPVLLLIGAGVTVLLLPDIANAPDTCDETYPSMSDGEFIVNAAILESIGFFSGKLIGTIFSKLSLLKEKLSIKILGNSNNFDMLKKGIDLDILSNSGKLADKGGLTRAGRAAQKHGSRHESAFPPQKGNLRTINQRGQDILDDILTDPNGYIVRRHHVKYGDIIEIRDSLGRGARFDSNGNFMGFLEP